MTTPVKLYVYDLSNGLARQLSLQLTGKQINGIWHTSVVVFGKEIFYGQGVCITPPGRSHHGSPLQVIDMGETAIDEETFNEYLEEIRMHYTADKYHLLEFNCNSFTNDCVGFLTGGSIPLWIKDLPHEFLSTPFGQALRPTIDSMFRRSTVTPSAQPAPPLNSQTASLLGSVASQAQAQAQSPTRPPSTSMQTLTSPIHLATNLTSFTSLLSTHKCLVAFFSSESCPPCRVIEPVFERIAGESASPNRVGFVKVMLGGYGSGSQEVAGRWNVRVTPTFLMFLEGRKVAEVKGADAAELKSHVDLLLFDAFPPHPHVTKEYRAVRALSLHPILFTQIPAWDAAFSKLNSFIDSTKSTSQAKNILENRVLPFLKRRFPCPHKDGVEVNGATHKTAATPDLLTQWCTTTVELVSNVLTAHEIFPLVDFWRVGLLDRDVTDWLAAREAGGAANEALLEVILHKAMSIVEQSGSSSRNVLLTTLRLLCNAFGNALLARHLLDPTLNAEGASSRQRLTGLLVSTLLHGDALVRTAAASLAFNIAAHQQKSLVDAVRDGRARRGESVADHAGDAQGDWEVEVVTAVVEAVRREESEDVAHRLTASLALFLHLSPYFRELVEILEVLGVKEILEGKAASAKKEEVRKLMKEVVEMCG